MKVSVLIMIMFWNQFLLAQETSKKLPVQLFATTDAYKIYDCQCKIETFDDYNSKIELGGTVGVLVPIYKRFFSTIGVGNFIHNWFRTSRWTEASDLSGKYTLHTTDASFKAHVWATSLFVGYEFGQKKFRMSPKIGLIAQLSKSVSPFVTGRTYYNMGQGDDYLNMEPDAIYSGYGGWYEGYSKGLIGLELNMKYQVTNRTFIYFSGIHLLSQLSNIVSKTYGYSQFSLGLSYSIGSLKE